MIYSVTICGDMIYKKVSTEHPMRTPPMNKILFCLALTILYPGSAAEAVSKKTVKLVKVAEGFSKPIAIEFVPGSSEEFFVAEQNGTIRFAKVSDNKNSKSKLVLDLKSQVDSSGNEMGLLGIAFHPRFPKDPRLFLNYTAKAPLRTVIASYQISPAQIGDPNSKETLLEINQPYSNHNGGHLAFGPDGYLYIGTGDGGAGGDPLGNGQNPNSLLGKMLRLHVDAIASDKIKTTKSKPEVWSSGLRNPWKYSFDKKTGELWLADVGQNKFEEINIIQKGENYGWNVMEGFSCFQTNTCDQSKFKLPVHQYGRSEGYSVTGGYVYRGQKIPELEGKYIFGDYVSGKIWQISPIGNPSTKSKSTLLLKSNLNISTFAQAADGELFLADHNSGVMFKIAR